jgi:predicted amidohydrolase YtcJ
MLIRGCEVDGRIVDVRVDGTQISAIGERLDPGGGVIEGRDVIEGAGGALLPGLHDHHLHLRALAAALSSVDCGPPAVRSWSELEAALRAAEGEWIRGVGYHESVAGDLDRRALDRIVPDRPVRVQHRSGSLWMTNSAALQRMTLDASPDVERDERGEPNGRLWRYDERLRASVPAVEPDLAAAVTRLNGYGITSVTDATPDAEEVTASSMKIFWLGRRKLLLPDHALPSYAVLRGEIARRQAENLPVAVHCVTRESLLLTLAVLAELTPLPGTRIEHAAVVPAGVERELARLGVRVVTQPDFLRTRGDGYAAEVAADDLPCLYPYERLRRAGVPVVASSDAPYGDPDPWRVIRSARDRTTTAGLILGASERVAARVALDGYLSSAHDPGGEPRRVVEGAVADLVLLRVPLAAALADPSGELVRAVFSDGVRRR